MLTRDGSSLQWSFPTGQPEGVRRALSLQCRFPGRVIPGGAVESVAVGDVVRVVVGEVVLDKLECG